MSDIKLFRSEGSNLVEVAGSSASLERELQHLFEKNLDPLLGVKFLASEFTTTNGRIDTIGLDENNCPIIIEYKRHASENIINQGLFYLDWLMDHKPTFELLVQRKINQETADKIDWSAPRLLCVASDFTRYDEHAIKQMHRNIELIRYRKFGNDLLMLELLTSTSSEAPVSKTPTSIRQNRDKPHDTIIAEAKGEQKVRFEALKEFILSLGDDVQERQLRHYIAFRRIKNFACIELRNQIENILVFVKLNPDEIEPVKGFTRDMRNIGHLGSGDLEITISSDESLERAKDLIKKSYEVS